METQIPFSKIYLSPKAINDLEPQTSALTEALKAIRDSFTVPSDVLIEILSITDKESEPEETQPMWMIKAIAHHETERKTFTISATDCMAVVVEERQYLQ